MTSTTVDLETIRQKYAAEREKRKHEGRQASHEPDDTHLSEPIHPGRSPGTNEKTISIAISPMMIHSSASARAPLARSETLR